MGARLLASTITDVLGSSNNSQKKVSHSGNLVWLKAPVPWYSNRLVDSKNLSIQSLVCGSRTCVRRNMNDCIDLWVKKWWKHVRFVLWRYALYWELSSDDDLKFNFEGIGEVANVWPCRNASQWWKKAQRCSAATTRTKWTFIALSEHNQLYSGPALSPPLSLERWGFSNFLFLWWELLQWWWETSPSSPDSWPWLAQCYIEGFVVT